MVSYYRYLDRNRQRELIKCPEFGMVSKCAKMCVNSLRLCTLEMQEVMMRQLPSVLLQLSKISATTSMAIPVLAVLSSTTKAMLKMICLPKSRFLRYHTNFRCCFDV